jgi:hypothetical protein
MGEEQGGAAVGCGVVWGRSRERAALRGRPREREGERERLGRESGVRG